MCQVKINYRKVYSGRVLWDAGNNYCAKFLTNTKWYDRTGHTLRTEKPRDLVEFRCFFGAISP